MTTTPTTESSPAPTAAGERTPASPSGGTSIGQWAERAALPLVLLVVVVTFSILSPHRFFTLGNLSSILGSQSILFMLALAALIPSMAGDIDLSLGATGAPA